MKGRGGGVKGAKTKSAVKAAARLEQNLERGKVEKETFVAEEEAPKAKSVLDRFKPKA